MRNFLLAGLVSLAPLVAACGGTGDNSARVSHQEKPSYSAYDVNFRSKVERDINRQANTKIVPDITAKGGTIDNKHVGCEPTSAKSFNCQLDVDFSLSQGGFTCSETVTGTFTGTLDRVTGDYEYHNLGTDNSSPDCY